MADYDGDIKLGVELDPKDVRQSANELEKQIKKVFDSAAGKNADKGFKQIQSSMSKTVEKATQLENKLKQLEDAKLPTQEYEEVSKRLEKANAQFDKLLIKQDEMQELGKTSGAAWDSLDVKMEQLGTLIREDEAELKMLVDTGKAFTLGADSAEYQRTATQLSDVNNQMRVLIERSNQYKVQGDKVVKQETKKSAALKALGRVAKNAIVHIENLIKKLAKLAATTFVSGIKKIGVAILNIGKNAKSAGDSAGKMVAKFVLLSVGLNSLRTIFSKLISSITEGIQSLAQFNGGANNTNRAMSSLVSSLSYLKNSWAAAFSPILSFVTPALTRLMDMLASVAARIGAVFAALSGATTFTRAKKVSTNYAAGLGSKSSGKSAEEKYKEAQEKAQAKYEKDLAKVQEQRAKAAAKAEEQQAKAAERLAKAQKEANSQLMGWDELNKLAEADVDDLLDSYEDLYEDPVMEEVNWDDFADAGGGGIADMFEEVPIDNILSDWLKDWVNRLKEAARAEDWEGVGEIIAEALNRGLDIVDDFINNKFRPFGVKWAKNIAEIGNGIVKAFKWEKLGKTLADGLNSIFDIANTFLTNFKFLELGKGIGRSIKSWFDNVQWDLIGKTFANKWNALFHTIQGIVTTPGIWESIGKSIAEFVKNWIDTIDTDSLFDSIVAIINGLVNMVAAFLEEDPFDGMGEKIEGAINKLLHDVDWEKAGATINELFKQVLAQITIAVEETDWKAVGEDIGKFLDEIDFAGIIAELADDVFTIVKDAIIGLCQTDSGRLFIEIVAGFTLLKGAFVVGKTILSPVISGMLTELGGQLVGKGGVADTIAEAGKAAETAAAGAGEATAAGMSTAAAIVGTAALGVADAALIAYDVDKLNEAWSGYHQAAEAHNNETETMLNSYSQLYEEKGKEVADQWAMMVLNLDTSGMELNEAQAAIAEEVEKNWDDVPQNMWEGFKQGWDSYFVSRENDGIKGLLKNAFGENGMIGWFKDLFDIHSPSGVFEGFGKDIMQGLIDGCENMVESVKSIFTNLSDGINLVMDNLMTGIQTSMNTAGSIVSSIAQRIISTVSSLVSSVASMISSMISSVSSAISSISSMASNIGSSISSRISSISSRIRIPHLAQGAVIPPNAPFLAMLGDQTSGQNIETPLDTMIEAFKQALDSRQGNSGSGETRLIVELDGRQIYSSIVNENNSAIARTGASPLRV